MAWRLRSSLPLQKCRSALCQLLLKSNLPFQSWRVSLRSNLAFCIPLGEVKLPCLFKMASLERLPPGTQRIEDKAGQKILLAPQPNADPNQPLVSAREISSLCNILQWGAHAILKQVSIIELVRVPQVAAHDDSVPLCADGVCHVRGNGRPSPHDSEIWLTFSCSLCVAVPLWQDFNTELGMSYAILNDGYATNMATLSVGCIIFVPIALRIGRRPVYIVTALIMLASAIWQAKMKTVGDMIGANAISGLAGAVNEAIFQVTVRFAFHLRYTVRVGS